MKRIRITLLSATVMFLILVLSSCQEQEQEEVLTPTDFSEEIMHLADHLGVEPSFLGEMDDYIIYEDMLYHKDGLISYFDEGEHVVNGRHYYSGVFGLFDVSRFNRVSIEFVDVPQDWVDAFRYAVDEWNDELDNVTFEENIIPLSQKIFISYNIFSGPYIDKDAIARLPINGNIGMNIYINSAAPYLSTSKKRHVAVHEIGHTLGFQHTDDPNTSSEYNDKLIDISYWCDNYENSSSVMTRTTKTYGGFSSCDKRAISALGF